ncbi:MAG: phytanoyl-CoA dioxygenase family protein [Deltaproteobacteria bacterium]|nr:phytanoyl-CoA dioxygenase family protein [Deltaproteobacteria bacterium]
MTGRLSAEQVDAYWRDGFVCVRGLFDGEEIAPWLARTRALASGAVTPPAPMQLVRDVMVACGVVKPLTPEHAVCKINFFENDDTLMTYARHARLLDCVESLLGEALLFVNSMLITKPPGVDARHPLHQDLLYFGFRPGDEVVGTWTALEPVTRDNGCLSVLPGSHRGELLEHEVPDWEHVNFGFLGASGVGADSERVHVEMAPGDTLLFHSLLLHGSGSNRTTGFRRAISAHYARHGANDLWGGRDQLANRPWLPVRGAAASA